MPYINQYISKTTLLIVARQSLPCNPSLKRQSTYVLINSRPDFSDYVGHFCKAAAPFVLDSVPTDSPTVTASSAFDRLISILTMQRILATPMPWTKRHAVAFTECPWGSLVDHSNKYSPFGVGFSKSHIFAAGGGPALYLRPDLTEKQQNEFQHKGYPDRKGFHSHLWAFVTPFVPSYAPQSFLEKRVFRESSG
jgi:hypothetical protein